MVDLRLLRPAHLARRRSHRRRRPVGAVLGARGSPVGSRRMGQGRPPYAEPGPAARPDRRSGVAGGVLSSQPSGEGLLVSPGGAWFAVFGFAAGILVATATTAIAASASGYRVGSSRAVPLVVTAADLAGLWVALVGAVVVFSRARGTGRVVADFGLARIKWWDLPIGAVIGLMCQYGLIPVVYYPLEALDRHLSNQLSGPARSYTGSVHSVAALSVLMLLLALGGPFVEELFFRGLLMRSLVARIGAPWAILLSAVLFALAHFEAAQFVGLAAFGVVLGFLAWATGRLAISFAAHAAFNAAAVLAVAHLK